VPPPCRESGFPGQAEEKATRPEESHREKCQVTAPGSKRGGKEFFGGKPIGPSEISCRGIGRNAKRRAAHACARKNCVEAGQRENTPRETRTTHRDYKLGAPRQWKRKGRVGIKPYVDAREDTRPLSSGKNTTSQRKDAQDRHQNRKGDFPKSSSLGPSLYL